MRVLPTTGSAFASSSLGGKAIAVCRRCLPQIAFKLGDGLMQVGTLFEHRPEQITLGPEPFEDRLDRKSLRAQTLLHLGPRQGSGDGRAGPWPERIRCRRGLADREGYPCCCT